MLTLAVLAALVLPVTAFPSHSGGAKAAWTYNYFGDTSQTNHSGHAANIKIHLQNVQGVNGYSVTVAWGVFWQGGVACSVFAPQTRITAQHVRITNSGFVLSHVPAEPGPDHTASFTAHFTKGHVDGTFTDTISNGNLTCTSGPVSYSAARF
jgi:hypothetical protein